VSEVAASEAASVRKLAPIFILAGIALLAAPIFHPNNTCADWLQKWGQLSQNRLWVPTHQVASIGLALAAAATFLLPLAGPRDTWGYLGGAAYGAGCAISSMIVLIHATMVSTIGHAYDLSNLAERRELLTVIATSYMSYDVAMTRVGATLIAVGSLSLGAYLYRIGLASKWMAAMLAILGTAWAAQHYPILRRIPTPEFLPQVSLSLWMFGVTALLLFQRRVQAAPTPAPLTDA
jgi:hypothetical protein